MDGLLPAPTARAVPDNSKHYCFNAWSPRIGSLCCWFREMMQSSIMFMRTIRNNWTNSIERGGDRQ
jgi:hypothetical protein